MTNAAFGVMAVSGLAGTAGVLMAFFPRVMPRLTNTMWAFFGMKSRLAEGDYERLVVRIAGGVFIGFAIFLLIDRWALLRK